MHESSQVPSLPEVHRSIPIPTGFWRKLFAFAGPGYLVAVGYMDPGNWATDLAGGARYGYTLLSVLLIVGIGVCFAIELWLAQPVWSDVLLGYIPTVEVTQNTQMLYIALGILGATVMPHNLYLHSSIVQTRRYGDDLESKREAIRFATIDSTVALTSALFINSAILIMAAAAFHGTAYEAVADISDAFELLSPLLGSAIASTVFALALLMSGQNSTITGTLAGQIVMEGFLNIRLRPWLRRLITRLIAVVPAIITIIVYGEDATGDLLVLSQVILSLQLSFAVFPLVMFSSDEKRLGPLAAPIWMRVLAWPVAVIIAGLNVYLLWQVFVG